jgi:hypothetical protein
MKAIKFSNQLVVSQKQPKTQQGGTNDGGYIWVG